MEQKVYRIAPYESEDWNWLWYSAGATFLVWCFIDNFFFEIPGWVYAVIFALSCLGFGLARIRQRGVELFLSGDGIRVCNGGRETVPLTPWSAFEQGYIVCDRSGGNNDTYFLLTPKPLDREELDRVCFDLSTTKPCGIWKDYIAVKTKRSHNKTIQTAIGERLRVEEFVYDMSVCDEEE